MARTKPTETPLEPRPETLAEAALDPKKEADVAKAISKLTPQEALHFLELLEKQVKARRIQLIGYLAALLVMLLGTVVALVIVGRADRGTFVGWVFFVPLIAVGIVLFGFGRWANRVK
jgi:hypothetical protein